MRHLFDQLWLLLHQRAQLIQRVKRQKLNAAATIDVLLAKLRDGVRHQPIGAAVAVGDRQADAFAVTVQQHVIHTPGINADTVDANTVFADVVKSGADLCFQGVDIPGNKTVLFLQTIGETVHFAKRKGVQVAVPGGEHYTAAGCA